VYDQKASETFQGTEHYAAKYFGSGSLQGFFVYDDIRLGSCTGKDSTG